VIDICAARLFEYIMAVAIGMQNFLKMRGWEKAIPREIYIHMSTVGYCDEGILYSFF